MLSNAQSIKIRVGGTDFVLAPEVLTDVKALAAAVARKINILKSEQFSGF